jgi:CRISPR-associated protein Cas2
MPRSEFALSEYRGMWLFAMFDLPVTTRAAKKRYTQFRGLLLDEGFTMLQFSVYARYCVSEEASLAFRNRVHRELPTEGHIRLLMVTDRQFGKMEVFRGKTTVPTEAEPDQLLLF